MIDDTKRLNDVELLALAVLARAQVVRNEHEVLHGGGLLSDPFGGYVGMLADEMDARSKDAEIANMSEVQKFARAANREANR